MSRPRGESSAAIRRRVEQARGRQAARFRQDNTRANGEMTPAQIEAHCVLGEDSRTLLRLAIQNLSLSARAYHRILRVARTIADLEGADRMQVQHVTEAIQFRTLDRQLW